MFWWKARDYEIFVWGENFKMKACLQNSNALHQWILMDSLKSETLRKQDEMVNSCFGSHSKNKIGQNKGL